MPSLRITLYGLFFAPCVLPGCGSGAGPLDLPAPPARAKAEEASANEPKAPPREARAVPEEAWPGLDLFIATVKGIEILGRRKATVHVAGVDPRFLLILHIDQVPGESASFKPGTDQLFAIHSPSKTFLAPQEDVIGKQFVFSFSGRVLTAGPLRK